MSIIKNVTDFVTKTVPAFVKAHPWEVAAGTVVTGAAVGGTVYAVNQIKKAKAEETPKLEAATEAEEAEVEIDSMEE